MHIQAPPNLSFARFSEILAAGIDDWGGISPITPDFVNPEAPWPTIASLRAATERFGGELVARLPVYPEYLRHRKMDRSFRAAVAIRSSDAEGWARVDRWSPGLADVSMQTSATIVARRNADIDRILGAALRGDRLDVGSVERLFHARGREVVKSLVRPTNCGGKSTATLCAMW